LGETVWAWEGVWIYCVDLHSSRLTLKETRGKTEGKHKKERESVQKQRRIGKKKQKSVKK
jgi:hypothetical protein